MSKKTKKNKNKNCNELKNNYFQLNSTKISYYYKKVFNIEIINLFVNKKIKEKEEKCSNLSDFIEVCNKNKFKFHVLIKDNNEKVFKYRIFTIKNEGKLENINFSSYIDYLYDLIDKKLGKYCIKKYLNTKKENKFNEILKKDAKINEDYAFWCKKNNK